MAKLREKYFNVGVYQADVVLIVGDYNLVHDWIKENARKDRYEDIKDHIGKKEKTTLGVTFKMAGGGVIIWMPAMNRLTLIHEIMHATHHILSIKGIDLNDETEEAYAYLFEYLYTALTRSKWE